MLGPRGGREAKKTEETTTQKKTRFLIDFGPPGALLNLDSKQTGKHKGQKRSETEIGLTGHVNAHSNKRKQKEAKASKSKHK